MFTQSLDTPLINSSDIKKLEDEQLEQQSPQQVFIKEKKISFYKNLNKYRELVAILVVLILLGTFIFYKNQLIVREVPGQEDNEIVEVLDSDDGATDSALAVSAKPSSLPTTDPTIMPSPSASIEPTVEPSPTTTPVIKKYNLDRSSNPIKVTMGTQYSIYGLLKYDGQVVTDQSNVGYRWSINDSNLASLDPFSACIEGIVAPCPEGHNLITPKTTGNSKITVESYWKDSNEVISSTTFDVEVVNPETQPPVLKISYPTEGQSIEMTDSQTLCVVEIPISGTGNGLEVKRKLNDDSWSSYVSFSTSCIDPADGSNKYEVQFRNKYGQESSVYSVNFSFLRI